MNPLESLLRAALLGAWLCLGACAETPPCAAGGECGAASPPDADETGFLQHRRSGAAAALNVSAGGDGRCCYGACPTTPTAGSCNPPEHWCSQSEANCEQRCDSSASGGAKAVYCPLVPVSPLGRCCYGMADCPDAPASADVPGCNSVEHFCSQSTDVCEHKCDGSATGGAKPKFCPLEPAPGSCKGVVAADPMELAVLSGDANNGFTVIPEMLAELGWSRGPRAVDPANKPHEFDIAQVYLKGCKGGKCDYCAIAFSATDDATDVAQAGNMTPVDFCGASNVRGGYVQEMRGFYADPKFAEVREALAAKGCCRVYATGHSLGGALAQLFAFCANQQGPRGGRDESGFAGVSDKVELVTFGAVRLSKEPLYNGKPGQCFEGARYSIDDTEAAPPPPTLQTQVLALQLVADSLALMNQTQEAEGLNQTAAVIQKALDKDQDQQAEAMIDQTLYALYDVINSIGLAVLTQAPFPWVPAVGQLWVGFSFAHRDELRFSYDVVPGMFDTLKFPGVAYRPLKNPESSIPAPPTPSPDTCFASAPSAPRYNTVQIVWGMMGKVGEGGGWFPNHALCCYIRALSDNPAVAGCGDRYFNVSGGCTPPTWR